jgi:hypothetical protein
MDHFKCNWCIISSLYFFVQIPVIRNDQFAYQEILKLPISEQGDCLRDCAREPTITEFCALHNTRES